MHQTSKAKERQWQQPKSGGKSQPKPCDKKGKKGSNA